MKTALKKFFMIMLLVVTPVSCVWADNVSDRKEIQTLFYSAVTSLNHKDAEGAAKTAAPDALLKRVDGTTLTIDEWKASTAKEFEGMKSFWTKFRLEKIDITDDQAKATYTETDNFLTVRQKSQRYHVVSRWNAELQKMPQGWLFKELTQVSERTSRDGKHLTSLVTGEVTRIRLVNYGRYEQKEIKNIRPSAEDEKMIGKQIVEIHQKHLQKTSRIKVGKGVLFGIEFKLVGKPLNSQAEVEVVHTHPPIKPPLPETEFSEQKYKVTAKIGSVCHALYMIENDWEMVEGKWTIQVNYHGRTLLEKTFELVRPKAAPSRKS